VFVHAAVAGFPARTIQIVVAFAAGSPPDALARRPAAGWKFAGVADAVGVNPPGAGDGIDVASVANPLTIPRGSGAAGDAADSRLRGRQTPGTNTIAMLTQTPKLK
jgi:hypothetical protein